MKDKRTKKKKKGTESALVWLHPSNAAISLLTLEVIFIVNTQLCFIISLLVYFILRIIFLFSK